MEIGSSFNIGVQGLQKANSDFERAASDIAQQTATNTNLQTQSIDSPSRNQSVDLSKSIVELNSAQNDVKANAKVVQSADETLGTIIDIRA